jgi:hypothetical protein
MLAQIQEYSVQGGSGDSVPVDLDLGDCKEEQEVVGAREVDGQQHAGGSGTDKMS